VQEAHVVDRLDALQDLDGEDKGKLLTVFLKSFMFTNSKNRSNISCPSD
jgi:hypothetical protein